MVREHPVIAIDTQTTLAEKTGFGYYVSNLVKELINNNPGFIYKLIAPEQEQDDFSMPQRFWWDQIEFPRRARAAGADLIHQPAFSAPFFSRTKTVVTIHDLIARLFGQDFPFWSRQYFAHWVPASYRNADHVIAISEHTKHDLIRELKIDPAKITVIYEAAGSEFKPIKDRTTVESVKRKYHINGQYFVHVGTLNPRKNLIFLVHAFCEVAKLRPDIQLVIAGKKGWYYEGLFELVKKLGLEKRVVFTGYLPDADRPILFAGALALVFPSLYEGFGLPPLEAMACGTPVIASDSSSIPEVVGAGGLLVDPKDLSGWVKAMNELIDRPKLVADLSQKGLTQSKKFSWKKTAEQTLQVYEHVLEVNND